ncbi:MAG: septal ring lytic transglycosylase RlpA family protein [Cyanobacteria bacterium P01_D01_bin.56]
MFDVPVLEVTVPPSSILVGEVSKNQYLATPHIPSALLNAVVASPQSTKLSADLTDDSAVSTESEVKTLMPQTGFQRLEPLNFAEVAVDLEKVVTLSIDVPAKAKISEQSPFQLALPVKAVSSEQGLAPDVAVDAKPTATMELAKQAAPVVGLREELRQCIDAEKPQDIPLMGISFQLLKQGDLVGQVLEAQDIETLVEALQVMLEPDGLNPAEIRPVLGEAESAIHLRSDVLLKLVKQPVAEFTAQDADGMSDVNSEWAAVSWSDQLRQAMGAPPLDPGDIQVQLKGLQPSEQQLSGIASWYGPYFHGRLTANGETFDQNMLTAAHKSLPFNTVLQVRNLKNNRTVVVRINDRGPYIGKRSLDLSRAAAQCLGSEKVGLIPYDAVILEDQLVETSPVD